MKAEAVMKAEAPPFDYAVDRSFDTTLLMIDTVCDALSTQIAEVKKTRLTDEATPEGFALHATRAENRYQRDLSRLGNIREQLIFQNQEKEKRAAELVIANTELLFQNEEKEKRAAELLIANTELLFQNEEKEKRAAELAIANIELLFQNKEKGMRAAELVIANTELLFQNEEKEKRAAELAVANIELLFQHKEKEKRAADDLLARRKAEFEKAQSQKMDAIGQLTGGLAHDFNNMLGVIIGNLDLLATSLGGNLSARARLETARSAALSGADLTRALMSVARSQAVVSEPVNLNVRLNELLPLIRHTAGTTISVAMALDAAAVVQVAPGGLSSTVLNLVINARDAMPNGGELTVSTQWQTVATDSESLTLPHGQYVLLSVSDTGVGMTPEVMAQASTPFFTTKERGRGTGLGLAMAHGFVKQCDGELLLNSEPGKGTTVKLILPAMSTLQNSVALRKVAIDVDSALILRGNERVLVVDDEIQLLALTATCLKELGYAVTPCASPTSALAALSDASAAGKPFALMVTDVIMPGTDGFALAIAARVICPELALLYVSGFADAADRGRTRPEGDILEKPFRQHELAAMVRDALDANSDKKNAE